MLRTTFGQLVSISGRAILAIGLTSATVLALAPSAKADEVFINNPVVGAVAFTQDAAGQTGTAIGVTISGGLASTTIGSLNLVSNSAGGYTVKAISANNGTMNDVSGAGVKIAYTMQFPAIIPFDGAIASGAGTAIDDVTVINATAAGAGGLSRDVKIKVLAADVTGKHSGNYSDVITFSYTAK